MESANPPTHRRPRAPSDASSHMKLRRFSPYSSTHPLPSTHSPPLPHRSTRSGNTPSRSPKQQYQPTGYLPSPADESPVTFHQINQPWSNYSSPSPLVTPNLSEVDFGGFDPNLTLPDVVSFASMPEDYPLLDDILVDSPGLDLSGMSLSLNPTLGPSTEPASTERVPDPNLLCRSNPSNVLSITRANISPTIQDANDASHCLSRSGSMATSKALSNGDPSVHTPSHDDDVAVLSVSTAFHPGSHPLLTRPDVIIVSADETLFYVHSTTLLAAAPHVFRDCLNDQKGSLIPTPPSTVQHPHDGGISPAAVLEASSWVVQPYPHADLSTGQIWLKVEALPAEELNVMLHAFYDTSCAAHQPSIKTLEATVDKMASLFGIVVATLITPSSKLFTYLLGCAPLYPLQIYSLAARHTIHELAVKASSHLLSFCLSSLTDEQALKIGAVYLKKLVLLHVQRTERLRDLLLKPPHPHPPSKSCGFKEQKVLESMWASVVVKVAWDVRPDLSTATLQRALTPVIERLNCPLCRGCIDTRIKDTLKAWASVEHCIT